MHQRDEFPLSVKRALASRVAHQCSNPDCTALTIGPGAGETNAVNLGVAAHITAAASGGPRFDASLTAEQRADISNGIWLCQNCARLIDADPAQFPADKLHAWKSAAEAQAGMQLGKGRPAGLPTSFRDLQTSIITRITLAAEQIEAAQREQIRRLEELSHQVERLAHRGQARGAGPDVAAILADLRAFDATPIVSPGRLFVTASSIPDRAILFMDAGEIVEYAQFPHDPQPGLRQLALTHLLSPESEQRFMVLPTTAEQLMRYLRGVPASLPDPPRDGYLPDLEQWLPLISSAGHAAPERITRLFQAGKLVSSDKLPFPLDLHALLESAVFRETLKIIEAQRIRTHVSNVLTALTLSCVYDLSRRHPRSVLLVSGSPFLERVSRFRTLPDHLSALILRPEVAVVRSYLSNLGREELLQTRNAAGEAYRLRDFIGRLVGVVERARADELLAAVAQIRDVRNALDIFADVFSVFIRTLADSALSDWMAPLEPRDMDEARSYDAARDRVASSLDSLLEWIKPLEEAMKPFRTRRDRDGIDEPESMRPRNHR